MSTFIRGSVVAINAVGMFANTGWRKDFCCAWFVLVGAIWAWKGFNK